MIVKLKRFSYGEYETEGILIIGSNIFATIEQPWTPNPNGAPGGKPFESCVPDGMYTLERFDRPSGAEVYRLFNPAIGVHRNESDHIAGIGRDLCLIHSANWATQVQGCIAPGIARTFMKEDPNAPTAPAVSSSRNAMKSIRELLGEDKHILSIENDTGAKDVV